MRHFVRQRGVEVSLGRGIGDRLQVGGDVCVGIPVVEPDAGVQDDLVDFELVLRIRSEGVWALLVGVVAGGVEAGQQDYGAAVGRIAQSGAEAIFYGGYYAEAGLIKKQLADQGKGDIPFVSDDGTYERA